MIVFEPRAKFIFMESIVFSSREKIILGSKINASEPRTQNKG